MRARGFLATCNAGGAGKWRDNLSSLVGQRHIVILPHHDQPGYEHAWEVAQSFEDIAESVRVLALPDLPPKGDVSDWLAAGGTAEELKRLVLAAPAANEWQPPKDNEGAGTEPAATPLDADPDVVAARSIVRLEDVAPEAVDWLWQGHLPLGKLADLAGDPGLGKSTITAAIAAIVTTATAWPDGTSSGEPAGVVFLSAEDGLADTVRPRLEAAGADVTRVRAIPSIKDAEGERAVDLLRDLAVVRMAVLQVDARLVVIDPIMAYLPSNVNAYKDAEVRRLLTPLAAFAEELRVTVLTVRHLSKMAGGSALYRAGGSIAFTAAARAAFIVGRDPDDAEGTRRVFAPVKMNLARFPAARAFKLAPTENGQPRVEWQGVSQYTADELATPPTNPEERTATEEAADFLRHELARGERPARDVQTAAERQGISAKALRSARERLGIRIRREGFGPGSAVYWSLPTDPMPKQPTEEAIHAQHPIDAQFSYMADMGNYGGEGQVWPNSSAAMSDPAPEPAEAAAVTELRRRLDAGELKDWPETIRLSASDVIAPENLEVAARAMLRDAANPISPAVREQAQHRATELLAALNIKNKNE